MGANNDVAVHQRAALTDLASCGLMIQCEPSGLSETLAASPTQHTLTLPPKPYSSQDDPDDMRHTPLTPRKTRTQRSPSPTKSPATPRTRRASSRPRPAARHSRKGSGQSSGRSPTAGFVNYTPSDSRKILTGVAPSGSSKTKARREKEAEDKRRRLSEVAKRVIIEAGGDVTALEREGLLCEGAELRY